MIDTPELVVHILWEGPFRLGEVAQRQDRGLYQIYGPHYVYGQYVLLYLGKTEQAFGARVPTHGWQGYERSPEVRVHLGRLADGESLEREEFKQRLGLAELLLIYAHGPAYNSNLVKDRRPDPRITNLRVFNWQAHGSLLPEVSGRRWLTKVPHSEQRAVASPEETS